ncbi:MAG: hypothetical protein AMXMBFR84_25890 [Candidatus Hydrogenedentota bacterium]
MPGVGGDIYDYGETEWIRFRKTDNPSLGMHNWYPSKVWMQLLEEISGREAFAGLTETVFTGIADTSNPDALAALEVPPFPRDRIRDLLIPEMQAALETIIDSQVYALDKHDATPFTVAGPLTYPEALGDLDLPEKWDDIILAIQALLSVPEDVVISFHKGIRYLRRTITVDTSEGFTISSTQSSFSAETIGNAGTALSYRNATDGPGLAGSWQYRRIQRWIKCVYDGSSQAAERPYSHKLWFSVALEETDPRYESYLSGTYTKVSSQWAGTWSLYQVTQAAFETQQALSPSARSWSEVFSHTLLSSKTYAGTPDAHPSPDSMPADYFAIDVDVDLGDPDELYLVAVYEPTLPGSFASYSEDGKTISQNASPYFDRPGSPDGNPYLFSGFLYAGAAADPEKEYVGLVGTGD